VRLDARVKLVGLCAASLLAVMLERPYGLALLCALASLAFLPSRVGWRRIRLLLLLAALSAWGAMFSQALFYNRQPRTVLLTIVPRQTPLLGPLTGGLTVYREGVGYGAVQSLRILLMLEVGLLVAWTTQPHEILPALRRARVPHGMALMVVTSLRFVPLVASEAATTLQVARLKGFCWWRLWRGRTWRTAAGLMSPVVANSLRRAGALAVSLQSRGYIPGHPRTSRRTTALGKVQLCAVISLVTLTTGVVVLRCLSLLYHAGLFYHPALRWAYQIARAYL